MSRIRAAVVGLGYWGPNLARNLQSNSKFELVALCDADGKRLQKAAAPYPSAKTFTDVKAMLAEARPDFVAVATPVAAHVPVVQAALEGGAHVMCEKPFTPTVREGEQLLELAAKLKRHLFVDHTFTYTGAVRGIRTAVAKGELGSLYYIDSVRINLGLFQSDVDVIWDLAPHDISIIGYVLGQNVRSVRATGTSHNPRGLVDVAYVDLEYASGVTAHLHLSWLSPVKVRQMIFSGSTSSVLFDDVELSEKIKIYDHGVSFEVSDIEKRRQVLVNYRRGDMRAPAIDNKEALGTELSEIADYISEGVGSPASGSDGVEVVRILEAAQTSLAKDGIRIPIQRG